MFAAPKLNRLLLWVCLVLAATSGLARADTGAPPPRIALVIGNSNYGGDIGNLANPANDAKLMAKTLGRIGFTVIEIEDADQNAMKRAIIDFGDKLTDAGAGATGLFYYAGHGLQVEGENYLIPVKAHIARESDVDIEAVSADLVLKQMDFAGSAVNIVILDACRNNPLTRGFRDTTRGLAEITRKPRGSFIAYSTAPGEVAADGNGANSPYAKALAEAVVAPGQGIEEVFREVRGKVLAATGQKQTPWDSSSLTAPFYFVPDGEAASASTAPAAPNAAVDAKAIELSFWDSIKSSQSPDDFQAYLQKYPQGDFVSLAQIRLRMLNAKAAASAAQPEKNGEPSSAEFERAYWDSVKDGTSADDVQAYLDKYPNGSFADLARTKLASLDQTRSAVPAPAAPTLAVTEMNATFVARQLANVRTEPATSARIVTRFKEDDAVAVTGKVEGKDWYRVNAGGDVGYVSAGLLQPSDPAEIADWRAARQAGTATAIEAFQAKHPQGAFSSKARVLLAALTAPAPAAAKPAQPPAAPAPSAASAPPPAPAPSAPAPSTDQASAAPAAAAGMRVGDVYDIDAKGTSGLYGLWWGNTRVKLEITASHGDGSFEGTISGTGEMNFSEDCDIALDGDNLTIRSTVSSVDNSPDTLRLHRTAPGRYDGRVQSPGATGTASLTLRTPG